MAHVIEGTWDEIKFHDADLVGHKVRLIVDPDEEDLGLSALAAPFAIRDREHLIKRLLEGVNSPVHEVTEETWARKHQELNDRYAARRK